MIGFIKRMPTQPFLCCLWLALVTAIFIMAAGADIKLLNHIETMSPLSSSPQPDAPALAPAALLPPPQPAAAAAGERRR